MVNTGGAEEHNAACKAGIARTALRCGDIRRGVNIAAEMNNRLLKRECAEILENKKVRLLGLAPFIDSDSDNKYIIIIFQLHEPVQNCTW